MTGIGQPLKFRIVRSFQRSVVNPVARRSSRLTMLETTGRNSGQPRHTAIGGRRQGNSFWFVSEHGYRSDYVRNIQAAPTVRVRLNRRWHTGTAVLLPEDDTAARLAWLGGANSLAVRVIGTELLTIRVDLTDE
jgi:deazaflavin-dependent oxidoreductase (nitroreductase family)